MMIGKKYSIKFPVGDWSGDGHSQREEYWVSSNKPTQEVREAHFKGPEVLGFEIGEICNDYEECSLGVEMVGKLKTLGFDFQTLENAPYDGPVAKVADWGITPDDIIRIWLFCLMKIDTELLLEIAPPPSDQSINFYGFDDKKRHLKTPGYGVFMM